jgi:hypothetical protein
VVDSDLFVLDQFYMSPPVRSLSPDEAAAAVEESVLDDNNDDDEVVTTKRKSDSSWSDEANTTKDGIAASAASSYASGGGYFGEDMNGSDVVAASPAKRKTVSLHAAFGIGASTTNPNAISGSYTSSYAGSYTGAGRSILSASLSSSAGSTPRPFFLSNPISNNATVFSLSAPTTPVDRDRDSTEAKEEIVMSSSAPKRYSGTILSSSPLKRPSNSKTLARIAAYPRVHVSS